MVACFRHLGRFGEDVVELHVHGCRAVVQGVLGALANVPGTRMADRGEFTCRAFRMAKLICYKLRHWPILFAETETQLQQALKQAGGQVSRRFNTWRFEMLGLLARTEACIDFGDDEEDVHTDEIVGDVRADTEALRREIQAVLQDNRGELIRDGVRVAIVGPPNAGKSSILNALAGRDAAIVSSIPGTTRDVVEVRMNLGGVAVVMQDTAGVHDLGGGNVSSNSIGDGTKLMQR